MPHPRGAKPKDVIDIPTTCNGMGEKTPHLTQKPEELVRKFVLASSNEGGLVIDPFSGSGTTVVVAEQLNRHWMACDLDPQYNQWAIERLESVRRMTKDEWIAHDWKTAERRESIRYLEYIDTVLQARIVSQNESHYQFFQYRKEGSFNITRPLNSRLMYDTEGFAQAVQQFSMTLEQLRDGQRPSDD